MKFEQLAEEACTFLRPRLAGSELDELEDYIVGFILIGAYESALRGAAVIARDNSIELPPHLRDAVSRSTSSTIPG